MPKASEIVGKPVIMRSTGEQRGEVDDLVLDNASGRVTGLLMSKEGWFGKVYVLPIEQINAIGPDAVLVKDDEAFNEMEGAEELPRWRKGNNCLKGITLMTEDGKDLGKMVDLEFSTEDGMIEGYEVSGGILTGISGRYPVVPARDTLKIGQDVAFVSSRTEDILERQSGGLEKAAERLKQEGEGVAGSFKEKSADFWGNIKEKVGELRGQATEEYQEYKIHRALGRPVNRVILDRNDRPILKKGDLITNEAIEQAKEAGVLDIVLNSVEEEDR